MRREKLFMTRLVPCRSYSLARRDQSSPTSEPGVSNAIANKYLSRGPMVRGISKFMSRDPAIVPAKPLAQTIPLATQPVNNTSQKKEVGEPTHNPSLQSADQPHGKKPGGSQASRAHNQRNLDTGHFPKLNHPHCIEGRILTIGV